MSDGVKDLLGMDAGQAARVVVDNVSRVAKPSLIQILPPPLLFQTKVGVVLQQKTEKKVVPVKSFLGKKQTRALFLEVKKGFFVV